MVRVSSMTGRLDHVATRENAENVLADYNHRRLRAKAFSAAIKSPSLSGQPKADSFENNAERNLVGHLDDQQFVANCDLALAMMESDTRRDLLKFTYIHPLDSVELIAQRLHMSRAAYYREKEKALEAFAEVWPPHPSRLLVYK